MISKFLKLLLAPALILIVSSNVTYAKREREPREGDHDTCIVRCQATDNKKQYTGVDFRRSEGFAACSKERAFKKAVAKCQKFSPTPSACRRLPGSCR